MIDLNSPVAFTPFIVAVALGMVCLVAHLRQRHVLSADRIREEIARDNRRQLVEAGLYYGAPNVDGHTGEVRAR